MAKFAILRFDKRATMQQIAEAINHHLRIAQTSNADSSRSHQNQILTGNRDTVYSDIKARIDELGTLRSNACRARGFLISASPGFFEKATAKQKDQWVKDTQQWLENEYGKNLVLSVVHKDETTWHIQGLILPIDSNNKLNGRKLFDRNHLLKCQREYPLFMQGRGHDLERGEEGSKAEHESIKDFYKRVKKFENAERVSTGRFNKIKAEEQGYLPEPVPVLGLYTKESVLDFGKTCFDYAKRADKVFYEDVLAIATDAIAVKKTLLLLNQDLKNAKEKIRKLEKELDDLNDEKKIQEKSEKYLELFHKLRAAEKQLEKYEQIEEAERPEPKLKPEESPEFLRKQFSV